MPDPPITGVPTSVAAFIGRTADGPADVATAVGSYAEYERTFGTSTPDLPMAAAVAGFFANGGTSAVVLRNDAQTGLPALDAIDTINMLVAPADPALHGADAMKAIASNAADYCSRRGAILIADPLDSWTAAAQSGNFERITAADLGIAAPQNGTVCTYFPRVKTPDPGNPAGERVTSAAGIIAGLCATADRTRGVWQSPGGIASPITGVTGLEIQLTAAQSSILESAGINSLRAFPGQGTLLWGARTLAGAGTAPDDFKYIAVRRFVSYIEASIERGVAFAAFEPNAEPLWARIRLLSETFLRDLAQQGALYDYFVRCDATTMTQDDINQGHLIVLVGVAPLKPAEFVIVRIGVWTASSG